jgi:hypothetical protein
MMEKTDEWREFEKLVAQIEKAASPHNAQVKSPDKIKDLITGKMREVDASIKYKVGTTDILITIECRKRGRKDDDTWIEQLSTKRQKIGASKTIAVSSIGFTDSAIKTAKLNNIELRTLKEISFADINNWFLPGGAVHVFRLIEKIRCFIVLYEESGIASKYGFYLADSDVEKPFFYQSGIKSPFPITIYIPILERTNPELFENVPFDGTSVELEFPVKWELNELMMATNKGKISVSNTDLIANVSYQSSAFDLKDGKHHEYSSMEGDKIQQTIFEGEMFDGNIKFFHQSDPTGEMKTSFKFSPKEQKKKKG